MNELREKILSSLTTHKECWKFLAGKDNLFLLGKIDAMETAIRIINKEFDKAERGEKR